MELQRVPNAYPCCHEPIKIMPIKDTAQQSLATGDRAVAFVVLLFRIHEGLHFPAPAQVAWGVWFALAHECEQKWHVSLPGGTLGANVWFTTSSFTHPLPSQRCTWNRAWVLEGPPPAPTGQSLSHRDLEGFCYSSITWTILRNTITSSHSEF